MVMVQLVAILPQGTSIRDKPEKNHKAPVDTDKGACIHPMADDLAMWTETVKDIDRLYMTVGAEAEAEAPHDEIARLTSGPRPAERLFWKEFRWTCKRKTFAITSPSVQYPSLDLLSMSKKLKWYNDMKFELRLRIIWLLCYRSRSN